MKNKKDDGRTEEGRTKKEKFRPIKCDKCRGQDFLRPVGYSDNGKLIEEWYSDDVIRCAKCGHPLHHNFHIIQNRHRVRVPILTEWIAELEEEELAKKENRLVNFSKMRGWDWFIGMFKPR